MPTTPTVFAIDDDEAILDSLRYIVEPMGYGYAAFSSASAFVEAVNFEKVGCLILDMGMPDQSGEELFDQLSAMGRSWPTIVITGHGELALGVRMVKKGVLDFLEKPFSAERLKELIEQAIDKDRLQRTCEGEVATLKAAVETLDEDLKAVLREIRKGKSSREIADFLDTSLRTVQLRRTRIAKHLQVEGRSGWNKLVFLLARLQF